MSSTPPDATSSLPLLDRAPLARPQLPRDYHPPLRLFALTVGRLAPVLPRENRGAQIRPRVRPQEAGRPVSATSWLETLPYFPRLAFGLPGVRGRHSDGRIEISRPA